MKSLEGLESPQDGCGCDLCNRLRACSLEYDIEQADTLPPVTPVKTADELLAEIKSALAGGMW